MDSYPQKRFLAKPKFVLREDSFDRDERYNEMYSRVIQNCFPITENFLREVKKILISGKMLLSSYQNTKNLEQHQCAYMLRFAIFDSSLSQQKFYESVVKYEKIVQRLSCNSNINICCVGSHGIFSVIGLCKVIEESVKQLGFQDDTMLVRIFVVDQNPGWKSLIKRIVDSASEVFPVLKLILNYIEGDFGKNFSNNQKIALRKSHLVTTVHHATASPEKIKYLKVLQNILPNMKKNAVLFNLFHHNEERLAYLDKLILKDDSFGEIDYSQRPVKHILDSRTELLLPDLHRSESSLRLSWSREVTSVMFSTYIKRPHFKVKAEIEKQAAKIRDFKRKQTVSSNDFYKAKKSSKTLRNSDRIFILDGKFAGIDMEKKNKDDSNRHTAKDVAVSRYANFDEWDY